MKTSKKLYMALLIICLSATLWGVAGLVYAQDLYYNTAGTVMLNPDAVEAQLKYAAWDWTERGVKRIQYRGRTEEACIEGATVVSVPTWEQWYAVLGFQAFFANGYADQCGVNGFLIRFRPNSSVLLQRTVSHETGHILINFPNIHHPDEKSLMHRNPYYPGITQMDVAASEVFPRWPLDKAPSYCHVALTMGLDLDIPEIELPSSLRARGILTYTPLRDAQGNVTAHQWKQGESAELPIPRGCETSYLLPNGNLRLEDVRGMSGNYSAELRYEGNYTWGLVWVETEE